MIATTILFAVCFAAIAAIHLAAKKKVTKRKKSSMKDPLLSFFGWEGTYLSLGKAIMVGSVTWMPAIKKTLNYSGVQVSPADIMRGVGPYASVSMLNRLNDALVAQAWLISGKQLAPLRITGGAFIAGTGASMTKTGVAGGIMHVAGKTKVAKKLTRGFPIKL